MTAGPNLRRWVRPAANAIATIGSSVAAVARSLTQSESKPRRSKSSTTVAKTWSAGSL